LVCLFMLLQKWTQSSFYSLNKKRPSLKAFFLSKIFFLIK
jgi:hypothetical protein